MTTTEVTPGADTGRERSPRRRLGSRRVGSVAGRDPRPFAAATPEPYRRRPSDGLRVLAASVLLGGLAVRATDITAPGTSASGVFGALPGGLEPLFRALGGLGAVWAVGLVGAAALVGRRWRLARDLLIAGLAAWGAARVLGSDVVGHVGLRTSLATLAHVGVTPSFPSVRLAIVVAVVATAGPYVGRPVRRAGQVLVVAVGISGLYLGTALPSDLLGALALGWGIAAVVHLAFGSPGGRPSCHQVELALADVGIEARGVRLAAVQGHDATDFDGAGPSGPLRVKVIGRDEVDAQFLAKAWRFLVSKEPVPPLHLSRAHQVEHEACMTLLARSAAVSVPEVVFVGRAGPDAALLVLRSSPGSRLGDLDAAAVTDRLLVTVWQEVAKLHQARVAHGALDAAHVFITDDGPTLGGFNRATTAGFGHRCRQDVAELLAATAAIVGDRRAVAGAGEVLGPATLAASIPFVQAAVLSRRTRSALGTTHRDVRHHLDNLRATAAEAAQVEPPTLYQPQRFRPANAALAVSSLIAIGVLFDQVGDPSHVWSAISHARWAWVAVALTASLATNLGYAVALMGTLPLRLPLWPTTEVELAMSYSNLVIPVIGGAAFQIRFLQRQGADLTSAVTAGGLLSTAGTVITQVPLFALAVWLSPNSIDFGTVPVSGIVKVIVLLSTAIGVLAAVAFGVPKLRRVVLTPVKAAARTMATAVRTPRQLSLIVGGNLVVSLLYGICLSSSLHAFGGSISFWTVLAINIGVGTIAALIPLPGGGTALGSIGLAGVLASVGVPTEVAVTSALANSLAVSYLPAVPGWFATRHLLQTDHL